MKPNYFYFLTVLFFILTSCERETGEFKTVNVVTAKTMTIKDFRSSVDIVSPRPIEESGKIYAYKNLVLVNDMDKGIHIINNRNPKNPVKIAFINIVANRDMEIRGNYLYADSLMDLLVFDIGDLDNIKLVARLTDVLQRYIPFPFLEDAVYENYNYHADEIVVGYDVTQERRRIEELNNSVWREGDDMLMSTNSTTATTTGQGGSLARFKIVDNMLYAVDSHNINIFNIENMAQPVRLESIFAGFDIETIFNRGNHLFLGSMRGMYIYDIENPALPQLVSEFEHGTACDPVVVDEDYAFITLRAGNACGALESSLEIVDISDIVHPKLVKTYPMDNPYGLGINANLLFICDGTSGLKVYDKTNVEDLKMVNHFKDIQTYDVIPLRRHLLMIGDKILYQYKYKDNSIDLLSKFSLSE
ncbi:MAG: hypothetical protein CR989_00615 [Flavobacteriales bacterium]|nr:MAG: hypothetical protein CR989_00615 [Flavobacteriales bacterium]